MKKWLILGLGGILFLSGCTTDPSMKGTPFYSTFYQRHETPDPDRVNTVLSYFSYDTLYIPWGLPLMEFGPDYRAVRPVYSVSDPNTDHPIYSVTWPIARFDPGRQNYRIFPVYWGDDYFNVVPLYWHEGDPFSGTGRDTLVPLWRWKRSDDGHYLGILWPLYANYQYPHRAGLWLWPAYGSLQKTDSSYRYVAWPFFHSFTNATESGHAVVPLWYAASSDDRSRFISLPYMRSMSDVPGATSWDLALPLCYRSWTGDTVRWAVIPALSWGRYDGDSSDNWFALGLGRYGRSADGVNSHVLPLYLYSRDPEVRQIYTLPWWSKKYYADGTGWNMLFPVYYYGNWEDAKSFYSIPYLYKKRDDGSGWYATIPLFYRGYADQASSFYSLPWFYKRNPNGSGWHTSVPFYLRTWSDKGDAWYTLPWSRVHNVDGSGWSTAIPFYFHGYSTNASSFYSPVWLSEQHPDGSEWNASFPFYFSSRSDAGSLMMTPLYARKLNADGSSAWRCYIPFVYFNDSYDSHFMTLLGGRWRMGENYNWLALPLLSGGAHDADSGRNVWLAGLAGNRWDEQGSSSYIVPLYYAAPDTLMSLPYAHWRDGDRKMSVSLPLLSGWYRANDLSGGWFAAALVGYRNGGEDPFHYVFPLYYHDPDKTLSLAYASWRNGDRTTRVLPWALSGWYRENDVSGAIIAAGLMGHRSGDDNAYTYLIPVFYSAPEKDSFLSLFYAKWRNGDRKNHMIPWLLSGWSTEPFARDVLLAGGLAAWRTEQGEVTASHLLPAYMYSKDEYLYTLLAGHNRRMNYYFTPLVGNYREGSGKSGSWAVPLYWHRRDLESDAVKGYYFPLGYYRKADQLRNHGFLGVYDYTCRQKQWEERPDGQVVNFSQESRNLQYLLFLGESKHVATYANDGKEDESRLVSYRTNQSFFPLWNRRINEHLETGKKSESASVLMIMYATHHEQNKERDYSRRQILWRLYRSESVNGDTFTDLPGVTINSYENGRKKVAVLWRLFRYEKNPENGSTKLDLLFVPLKR